MGGPYAHAARQRADAEPEAADTTAARPRMVDQRDGRDGREPADHQSDGDQHQIVPPHETSVDTQHRSTVS